jgi:hypothetical protein
MSKVRHFLADFGLGMVADKFIHGASMTNIVLKSVDPTPDKDSVLPEVQSPTAKLQVTSVPHTTNHSPTVPTNIQEYIVDS